MTLTKKHKLKYYKNRDKIKKVILRDAKQDKHIIFGAQAVNVQMMSPLKRFTEDFDIYARNPRKQARETERLLDTSFGFNAFESTQALHPGTWKVRSRVTKRGVADYSKRPKGKIKTVRRKGVRYAHTSHQLKQIKKSLKDPKSKFRHDKDRETRQRIMLNP